MKNVTVVDHPFVTDSLGHLRDKNTGLQKFRHHSDKLCQILFYEALRSLDQKQVEVETPLETTKVEQLSDEVVVVPVLRAGLAMMFGAMKFLPKSKFGFVGLERDEGTAVAKEYYWKLPEVTKDSVIVVTDPMLATGGSTEHVLDRVSMLGPKQIVVVCVVTAPEGVEKVKTKYPEVEIVAAAVDSHLNDLAYIVPGIGDYGDRYFGTES